LCIENAYFLPDDLTRKESINAAKRGVKVEIIVPGKLIDQKLVRAASKRHWPELLKANAKIYEYQPTMVHVKLMIVNGTFVSVGSGNFDNRSISLNDEANLDVLDRNFAAQQTRLFEMDKKQSHEMALDEIGGLHPSSRRRVWLRRNFKLRLASRSRVIAVGAKLGRLPILKKYYAELTKYWLDRDGSRIHSSCRIHLATWFADLGRKHEPDGL